MRQGLDGGERGRHRPAERRAPLSKRHLQSARREPDVVEKGRRCEAGRRPDECLQRERGLFGLVDARGVLGESERNEALAQLLEAAAAGGIAGDLAERRDRDRLMKSRAAGDRQADVVQRDPAPRPVPAAEGAEIDAGAVGLGREHRLDSLVPLGQHGRGLGRTREVIRQTHASSIDSAPVTALSARRLFAPLGPTYDRYSSLLSFGQDPRWRRFLVSRVDAAAGDTVLDVATGTGMVARELVRRTGCTVVGLDQSAEMLATAAERTRGLPVTLVEGRAESLPFADGEFAALTFTYLLRYVDDPEATLRELARVVRPGGTIAMLEFGLPRGVWRPLWELWVRIGLPLAGRLISPGWHEVGRFLGPSIRGSWQRLPEQDLLELWLEAGITEVRARRLSVGGGIVVWGRRA